MRALGLILLLALAAPAAAQAPVTETRCDVLTGTMAGEIRTVRMPGLHVLEGTASPGPFRPDLPHGASAIMCGRSSIVPAEHDDEVVGLGVPLIIVEATNGATGRLATLEIVDGRYRFRFIEGQAQPSEEAPIQQRLDQFQTRSQGD
jgi:hypothetical protein